jgi:hypothetical protein
VFLDRRGLFRRGEAIPTPTIFDFRARIENLGSKGFLGTKGKRCPRRRAERRPRSAMIPMSLGTGLYAVPPCPPSLGDLVVVVSIAQAIIFGSGLVRGGPWGFGAGRVRWTATIHCSWAVCFCHVPDDHMRRRVNPSTSGKHRRLEPPVFWSTGRPRGTNIKVN